MCVSVYVSERENMFMYVRLRKMCVKQIFVTPLRLGRWPEFNKNIVFVIVIVSLSLSYFYPVIRDLYPVIQGGFACSYDKLLHSWS